MTLIPGCVTVVLLLQVIARLINIVCDKNLKRHSCICWGYKLFWIINKWFSNEPYNIYFLYDSTVCVFGMLMIILTFEVQQMGIDLNNFVCEKMYIQK